MSGSRAAGAILKAWNDELRTKDMPKQDIDLEREESADQSQALTVRDVVDVEPTMTLARAKERFKELQQFVKFYLKAGEDFGTIPGTPKPTLYKSGADKLCDIYGLSDSYRILSQTADWDKGLFDYEIECLLTSRKTGLPIRTGLGSCSSFEGRYLYRNEKPMCPKCGKTTIIKGKKEWGGGWVCWKKEGKSDGCGAKFHEIDSAIMSQAVGKTRIPAEELASVKNTVLKMARKRALVDATIAATRSSGLFTQDIGDAEIEPAAQEVHAQQEAEEVAKKHGLQSQPGTKAASEELSQKRQLELLQAARDRIDPKANPMEYAFAAQAYLAKRKEFEQATKPNVTQPEQIGSVLKKSLEVRRAIEMTVEELYKLTPGTDRYISRYDEYARLTGLPPGQIDPQLDIEFGKLKKDDEQKAAGLITSKQQRMLHAIWTRREWADQRVWSILSELWGLPRDEHGKVTTKAIKAADFQAICEHFDKLAPPVEADPMGS